MRVTECSQSEGAKSLRPERQNSRLLHVFQVEDAISGPRFQFLIPETHYGQIQEQYVIRPPKNNLIY